LQERSEDVPEEFEDVPENFEALNNAAIQAVLGVDVSVDYDDVTPETIGITMESMADVDDVMDRIDAKYQELVEKAEKNEGIFRIDADEIRGLYRRKVMGPIVARMLDLVDDFKAGIAGDTDGIVAEFNRLAGELAKSDELKPWSVTEDTEVSDVVLAKTANGAIDKADLSLDRSSEGVEETFWTWVSAECMLTGEADGMSIATDPDEPECADYGASHDWCSPYSVLGGDRDNPGVRGNRGGVIITTVCSHCGTYCVNDTWARNPENGEEGLESVEYRNADSTSLAFVLSERLKEQRDDIPDDNVECHNVAVKDVLGVDVPADYDDITERNISASVNHMENVKTVLDNVKRRYLVAVLRARLQEQLDNTPRVHAHRHDDAVKTVIGVDVSSGYDDITPQNLSGKIWGMHDVNALLREVQAKFEELMAASKGRSRS
jgi:hypothetical protein